MVNVKLVSRHGLTPAQYTDLTRVAGGPINVIQVNETIEDVSTLIEDGIDIYAVVLSVDLIAELAALTNKPIIFSKTTRERTTDPEGTPTFEFNHVGWYQFESIKLKKL